MPNNVLPFFIALFILIALVFIIIRNAGKKQASYDERQLLARNMAYKWAFAALGVYFVGSELVTLISENEWCTPECNLGLGLSLSLIPIEFVCIFRDVIPRYSWIYLLIISVVNLFTGIGKIISYGVMQDGKLNIPIHMFIGVIFALIFIAQLIKIAVDKKKMKAEALYEES